ncbi:hypothetical protein BMS3Abin16_01384 [archaeon BMS3Abin16]|nr:hypothetical protein BMS3Abin16_01384 [archaeon BMS3Abin16]
MCHDAGGQPGIFTSTLIISSTAYTRSSGAGTCSLGIPFGSVLFILRKTVSRMSSMLFMLFRLGIPPCVAHAPIAMIVPQFFRISSARCFCSSSRIPPVSIPTSAFGRLISSWSPFCPKYFQSMRTGIWTNSILSRSPTSGSPISRIASSHPPQMVNHSSATVTFATNFAP